jgi:protein-disulfide isomerase
MNKVALIIAIFVLIFGGYFLYKDYNNIKNIENRLATVEKIVLPPEEQEQKEAFDLQIGDSHYLGNKDAKIVITLFTNAQCGYCAKADQALRKAMEEPELKNNAVVVIKHFPFMTRSKPAAKAAFAAGEQGQDNFWLMLEKIYANQRDLTDENFTKWATELKLDVAKFNADLKAHDEKYENIFNKDMELVRMVKIDYTPAIFVNGWKYEGDLTAKDIQQFAAKKAK